MGVLVLKVAGVAQVALGGLADQVARVVLCVLVIKVAGVAQVVWVFQ